MTPFDNGSPRTVVLRRKGRTVADEVLVAR
jgi:hypothetical protein